jgi:hypothetical protein
MVSLGSVALKEQSVVRLCEWKRSRKGKEWQRCLPVASGPEIARKVQLSHIEWFWTTDCAYRTPSFIPLSSPNNPLWKISCNLGVKQADPGARLVLHLRSLSLISWVTLDKFT